MAMPSIFLSYARQDIDTVANLAQQLRALGSTVWRDQDSLRGGQHWPQIIGEAIDTHDVFLLVWSQHAAQSHFVEWEWNTATAVSKPFLPCVLDATPLPAALRALHAVPGHSLSAALPAIADVLQQWAHGSTTAPRISHRPAAPAGRWLTTQDRMGHEAEHAHLLRLSTQMATEPHGYIVWVTAPQGYGRHALVHSLAAQAQAEGSAVVALDFHQEALPLAPELAPYEALVRQHYPKSCGLTDATWMACMAQLMRLVDDQTARERLVRVDDNPERGLATWLRTLTRQGRQRLVLVWEAFDAAPDFWLDLLRYLADEICLDLPVLLLPTALAAAPLAQLSESQRSQALHLAQTLMELDRATLLWLDRVTVQDVAHYLGPADPVLAERLHTLTDGLPALVESLWRQWREASPPAVVFNAGRWSIAREDDVWVFGEAHDQVYALLEACLGPEAPFTRRQVEDMLICAALEGLTCTAQAVAQVLGVEPDDLTDFWDDALLGRDSAPGLLLDAGFTVVPTPDGGTIELNSYRFTWPYLAHVWLRYCPRPHRQALQHRLLAALESLYALDLDQVSPLLAALYDATGQPVHAAFYRQSHQHRERTLSLETLRWQVRILEGLTRHASDDYRLFELRLDLCERLWEEHGFEEGAAQAAVAVATARAWQDQTRLVRALRWLGNHLWRGDRLAEAHTAVHEALTLGETVHGPTHPDTAVTLHSLGQVLQATGEPGKARDAYARALHILQQQPQWHAAVIQALQQHLAEMDEP